MANPLSLHIRPAIPSDIPSILSIKAAFEELHDRDSVNYDEYYRSLLTEGIVLVADHQGEVVGFVAAEILGSLCYVADAGVGTAFQKAGVFMALCRELETRIRDERISMVVCHVKESNTFMMEILESRLQFKRGDRYILFSRKIV